MCEIQPRGFYAANVPLGHAVAKHKESDHQGGQTNPDRSKDGWDELGGCNQ